jgi:hypothetical protein
MNGKATAKNVTEKNNRRVGCAGNIIISTLLCGWEKDHARPGMIHFK